MNNPKQGCDMIYQDPSWFGSGMRAWNPIQMIENKL